MDKLLRQLKRDLKKNPKKAALLVLLCVGAVYSWGSLMVKPEQATPPKPAAAAATPSSSSAAGPSPASSPRFTWRDLAQYLSTDERMQSLHPNRGDERRDPFAPAPQTDDEAELDAWIDEVLAADTEPAVSPPPSFDLFRVPLVLSGTIIGDHVHRAIINGRTFEQGDLVRLKRGAAIRLTSVEPRHVVLEWNGERRELKIPRPGEGNDRSATPSAADLH